MKKLNIIFCISLFFTIVSVSMVNSCLANNQNESRWIMSYNDGKSYGALDKRTLKYNNITNHAICWIDMKTNYGSSLSLKIDYTVSSRKYTNLRHIESFGYSSNENKNMANKEFAIIPDSNIEKVIDSLCDYLGQKHPYDHINDKWTWVHSSNTTTYNIWSKVYPINDKKYDVYVKEISPNNVNSYHCIVNLAKETIKYSHGVEKMIIPGTIDDAIMLKVKYLVK